MHCWSSVPSSPVFVLSLSDFNRALSMQGKEPYHLSGNEFLLNCNYEGTMEYVKAVLERSPSLTIAGAELKRASATVLTETADSIRRFHLLQKLGASRRQVSRSLFWQTAVFFLAPLALAVILSSVFLRKAMETVEEFMNMHISTNVVFTAVLFLLIYGIYFLATCMSCKSYCSPRTHDKAGCRPARM